MYPAAVMWAMLLTFGMASLLLITSSPVHRRDDDPLFWFIALNAAGLFVLAIILHHERGKEERERFIRISFLADWLLAVSMAAYQVWKHVRAGTFW
jgi:hypothetical protein